jgi:hypothetical protein
MKLFGFRFLRQHLIVYQVAGQECFYIENQKTNPARALRTIQYNSLSGAPPLPILGRGRGGYNFDTPGRGGYHFDPGVGTTSIKGRNRHATFVTRLFPQGTKYYRRCMIVDIHYNYFSPGNRKGWARCLNINYIKY